MTEQMQAQVTHTLQQKPPEPMEVRTEKQPSKGFPRGGIWNHG